MDLLQNFTAGLITMVIFILLFLGPPAILITILVLVCKKAQGGAPRQQRPGPSYGSTREQRWYAIAYKTNRQRDRDPIRFYGDSGVAPEAKRRAGYRCEHRDPQGNRCPQTNELHVDHIYPWYHGGWTILSNAQMLCKYHNQLKGASIPTQAELQAIYHYRQQSGYPREAQAISWKPSTQERAHRQQWLQFNREFIPPMPRDFR